MITLILIIHSTTLVLIGVLGLCMVRVLRLHGDRLDRHAQDLAGGRQHIPPHGFDEGIDD